MPSKAKTAKKPRKTTRKQGQPSDAVVAITGTRNFLSNALLHRLEADKKYRKIVAIGRRRPSFKTKKTQFHRLDLTKTLSDSKLAAIFEKEGVTHVIHAALPISPLHDSDRAHEMQSIGTLYLLNASAHQKVKKLILASTTDVYGARPTNPNYLSEQHIAKGGKKSRFLRDKIDAEKQFLRYAKVHPETVVTILRPCTMLGSKIKNFKTTFLRQPVIFTVMGYDPLMQFVHEDDAIDAFWKVLNEDHPGIYNIVGDGVIPLSKVLHLSGKVGVPVPSPVLYAMARTAWYANLSPAPASHLDFLKYLCVADGQKAHDEMKFRPKYSSREALMSFIGAERLRKVNLMQDEVL